MTPYPIKVAIGIAMAAIVDDSGTTNPGFVGGTLLSNNSLEESVLPKRARHSEAAMTRSMKIGINDRSKSNLLGEYFFM
jgi:hypothetical protein